jgi:serine acetyltransferase
VNGHTNCGVASFLGAGAIVLPHVSLGNYSKLSAGSVLKDDAGEGFVMHGNPAKGRQLIQVAHE